MTDQNKEALSRLDQLFETEEVKAKSFNELLEEAEMFESDYDPDKLMLFFKDVALAKLNIAAEERIYKALKRKAKVSAASQKKMLQQAKGKHTSSDEDFGRQLCKATLERHFFNGEHITRFSKEYFAYNGKHWEHRDEDQIAWYVSETLLNLPNPDGVNHSGAISQALNLLRAVCSKPGDPFSLLRDPPNIICVQNGELWVQPDGTVQLKQHHHASYQLACLEVTFDAFATCPEWDKALLAIFQNTKQPAEMVRHLEEWMGYVIQQERDIASWWLLKGQGENGKTKIVETLIKLLGPTAVSIMRIQTLGVDKFATAGLVGKRMVLEEDMDKNAHLPDGMLKSISEKKNLEGEYKGGNRFPFICRALPVMLSNHFPKTNDLSHGMLRRANVIPFTRQFKGREADRALFPRIWASELPGVLNRALQGLQRLRARGHFQPPQECIRAVDVWSTQANPVKAFISEALEPAPECRLRWTDVYNRFKDWASEENLRFVPGRNTVKREFEMLGVSFKWDTEGNHMVAGYGLRTRDWNKPEENEDAGL